MVEQNKNNKPVFKGKILLCEDNELMQSIIKSQLTDIGFEVIVANNGKECLDIIKYGDNSFGLIFMDIYMPVMDGIEAADALKEIGNNIPIIALTANVEINDIENHKAHNMQYSIKKPVAPEELWNILCKYFTPLNFVNENKNAEDINEKQTRLLTGFLKRNKTASADIRNAIEIGDIKLAHRLAHTIKGLAGLMEKKELLEVSGILEYSLAEGITEHLDDKLTAFENEMTTVLNEIVSLLSKTKVQPEANISLDKNEAAALFEKLEPLLRADSAKCREFTDGLKSIPGTAELIEQIDEYEFEKALEILIGLKMSLGIK